MWDREAKTADANHDSDIAMRSLFTSILFKNISVPEIVSFLKRDFLYFGVQNWTHGKLLPDFEELSDVGWPEHVVY